MYVQIYVDLSGELFSIAEPTTNIITPIDIGTKDIHTGENIIAGLVEIKKSLICEFENYRKKSWGCRFHSVYWRKRNSNS